MKTRKYTFFLLFCNLTFWIACSNDINLNAPAEEIPIVYAVLSPADEAHYIRVERAFLEDNTSALTLAQQPDQLYFDNITVELVNVDNGQTFQLTEVDGRTIGLEREAGVFATTPNILYGIAANELQLQPDGMYQLNIFNGNGDTPFTTANTVIVGNIRLNRPIPGANKLPLRIEIDEEFTVLWGADESATFFDVKMNIHFNEWMPNVPGSLEEKTLTWTLSRNINAIDGANRIEVEGIEFYQFLANTLAADPAIARSFNSIDIQIDAGGEELFNYINVGQANTGITSSQVIPVYTNLSNGLGIFASRNQLLEPDYSIDVFTQDELIDGDITRDLNFQ